MSFLHPAFLWALPFALVPLIIYYLMRFRSVKVTWGANYVLERALDQLRKKLHLDQIILLALRTLAAALLILAFARPSSTQQNTVVAGSGTHRVLLVDGSYSLLAGESGRTRWDRLRETMRPLIATWPRGEPWSVCLLADKPIWIEGGDPALVLEKLTTSETAVPLARGLAAVQERFPDGNVELYLFADDQATAWEGVTNSAGTYWINPPLSTTANAGLTSARFDADQNLVGHPTRLAVTVRNFSDEPLPAATVELLLDGAFHGRESVPLLPRQERQVTFTVVFDKPGAHSATARLSKDALVFDNTLAAGIEIVDQLAVLVLRDPDRAGKFDSAGEFLHLASRAAAGLTVTIATNQPTRAALAAAHVVVLDGGCRLTPALVSALREYVTAGGALVLAADEQVPAPTWNSLLRNARLLPALLGVVRQEPLNGPAFQSLARSGFALSPLRAFEGDEDGDVTTARFYAWREFGALTDGATVLATFADGRPWVVRQRFGPGSVTLVASGLNGASNNLIVREYFLPLLVRLFADAAAGSLFPRTVATREPIRLRVAAAAGVRSVAFQAENAEPVSVTPQKRGDELWAALAGGWDRSGLCSFLIVRDNQPQRVWIGVQGARVDSDLTPLTPAAKAKLGAIEVADWPQLDEALQASRRGGEWHHWAILALLGLLVGEMLMQRRFL